MKYRAIQNHTREHYHANVQTTRSFTDDIESLKSIRFGFYNSQAALELKRLPTKLFPGKP